MILFIIISLIFFFLSFSVYKDGDLNYPIVEERVWERNAFHYDNVAKAILTLFVVATFEGWPGILYVSIDSNAEDIGPVHNYRPIVAIFYFIYIIIIGKYCQKKLQVVWAKCENYNYYYYSLLYGQYLCWFCHRYLPTRRRIGVQKLRAW